MIEVAIRISGEEVLNRIEIWLKASIEGEWQLEFGGIDDTLPPGQERRRKPRFLVRYRFTDPDDAEKFRKAYKEGWVLPSGAVPRPPSAARSRSEDRPSDPRSYARRAMDGISGAVTRMFASPAPTVTAPPRPASATEAGLVSVNTFSSYVAEVVRLGKPASASKVQLIGLERLQAHFGEGWTRVAHRADEIARRTIQSRLGKADVFTAVQGWKYLILFPELSVPEAQLKSASIAEEISRAILGDQMTAGLVEVRSAVMAADGGLSFELTPALEDVVHTLAQKIEDVGASASRAAHGFASDDPLPPDNDPVPPFSLEPLDVVQVWYRPIVDMRLKIVAAYQATPTFEMPDGSLAIGERQIPDFDHPERHYRLDLMLVTRAIRDINANIMGGRKRLILVGVNFETLAVHGKRMEYMRRLDSVLWPARQLLVFQIKNLPDGASPSRLHEMIMTLKRHARAITLQLPINTNYVGIYRELALHSVGVDLAGYGIVGDDPPGLQRFAARARKAGMEPFVSGLSTRGQVETALAAGYRYLVGDGVAPALPTLGEAVQIQVLALAADAGGKQDKRISALARAVADGILSTISPASSTQQRLCRPPGSGLIAQSV